ncbi:MAG: hypothetical protein R3E39_28150 [Anaerolineae bacterium]
MRRYGEHIQQTKGMSPACPYGGRDDVNGGIDAADAIFGVPTADEDDL